MAQDEFEQYARKDQGDDEFAQYARKAPVRPPDQLVAGPGFLKRQALALQDKWRQANTPVGEGNPTYQKEREHLQGWYGVGPEADKHNQFRIEHPILASAASVAASIQDRGADLLSPAFIATAAAGPIARGLQETLPESAGVIKAVSPYAKWSTAGAYGVEGAHNAYEGAKTGNLSEMLGGATMMFPLIGEGLTAAGGKAVNTIRPKVVKIAGVEVPLLSGEADPMSLGASAQAGLKSGGFGSKKFMQFAEKQQAAVKKVISTIAAQTSDMTGFMGDEPGQAVKFAGDVALDKARPMYKALDASMTSVPDTFANASKLTKQAIARASKLGVEIDTTPVGGTHLVDKAWKPVAPNDYNEVQLERRLKSGDYHYEDVSSTQPLTTFMKVKSELLKMSRMSNDPAHKYAIFNEVKAMDEAMSKALDGTPLYGNYKEASRLWAKGRSLQEISEELRQSTKGVPTAFQHPDLAKIPTEIQGSNLVSRLNDLYQEGTLARAFTFNESKNLFQAADILDRASLKVGRFGVPIHGYGGHSTIYDAVKRLGMRPFISAMTTVKGVEGAKVLAEATTKAGQERALNMLAAAAAELSTPKKANLDDVKKQAQEIQTPQPKAAPGPQSSVPKSSSIDEVKTKGDELYNQFHKSGFAPAPKDTPTPSPGPQSSAVTHRFNPTTGQIEAA
jgi:hypothetical protein